MVEISDAQVGSMLSVSIKGLFKKGISLLKGDPSLFFHAMRHYDNQRRASIRRKRHENLGIHVPPFMILSMTHECNLNCQGCYSKLLQRGSGPELDEGEVDRIIKESSDLGISVVLVAGGEPLVKDWIIDLLAGHSKMLFLLFTNGTMLDEAMLKRIKEANNIIPMLSIEGLEADTDGRRGLGVWDSCLRTMELLHGAGLFFGVSLTVTRANHTLVTSDGFIGSIIEKGPRLFIFVEYVPVKEGSETLCLDEQQVKDIEHVSTLLSEKHPGIFISFPGDEDKMGGCLSSGRGFVHVNPWGDLEPCPFAPYSDMNLRKMSMKEALSSPLLREIRSNREMVGQVKGGCALWEHREWVQSISAKDRS
ncbi:MAG: radical SAM protein [Candidatus Thermoplasmatota archaeon]|nr:radical SAM protein [Candidatus Thermoplasmatota archaeon]